MAKLDAGILPWEPTNNTLLFKGIRMTEEVTHFRSE
jgi:hypothetical protein